VDCGRLDELLGRLDEQLRTYSPRMLRGGGTGSFFGESPSGFSGCAAGQILGRSGDNCAVLHLRRKVDFDNKRRVPDFRQKNTQREPLFLISRDVTSSNKLFAQFQTLTRYCSLSV